MKKIIAREFLYLILVFVILLLIYLGNNAYNFYQARVIDQNNRQAIILKNQYQSFLSQPLNIKNKNITQGKLDRVSTYINSNAEITIENILNIIPTLKNDSILLQAIADYAGTTKLKKYKYLKEQNLKFPEIFVFTPADIDSLNYFKLKIDSLNNINIINKRNFETNGYDKFEIYKIALWLFLLIFGLRYLYYATKWSISTLKAKNK